MRRNQGGQKYKYIALSLSLSCESDFFILFDMSKENIKNHKDNDMSQYILFRASKQYFNVGHFRIRHGKRVFFKLSGMVRLQK